MAARVKQMVADYSGWRFANRDPKQASDTPAIQRLSAIVAPTLVIVGERDVPDFQAIAVILAQAIPSAQKVVLPGAGHVSNVEDPAASSEAVLGFLAGI